MVQQLWFIMLGNNHLLYHDSEWREKCVRVRTRGCDMKAEAEDSCSSVRVCLLKRTCVKQTVCISVGLWQLPVTSRPLRNSCWERVCVCVPPCVIASVCWCKSHVKGAFRGEGEVVSTLFVIEQHTALVRQQWNKSLTLICVSVTRCVCWAAETVQTLVWFI